MVNPFLYDTIKIIDPRGVNNNLWLTFCELISLLIINILIFCPFTLMA